MLSGIKYTSKSSKPAVPAAPVIPILSSSPSSPARKNSLTLERISQDSSLQELIQNEHLTTSQDYTRHFAKTISKETEDDYDLPPEQHRAERIDRHRHSQPVSGKTMTCPFCIDSSKFDSDLVICLRDNVMVMMNPKGPLMRGNCCIVPIKHTLAISEMDEDEYSDVQDVKRDVLRMYREKLGKRGLFVETVLNLRDCDHTLIEAFPVNAEADSEAPIMFHKEFSDSDAEWSDNKKVIKINRSGIQRAVPKGFPYIHVDFNCEEGLAHIIEDFRYFSANLGREIVGELVGIDPMMRKRKLEKSAVLRETEALKELFEEIN